MITFSRKSLPRIVLGIFSTMVLTGGIIVALIYAQGNTITTTGIQATGTIKVNIAPDGEFAAFLNEEPKRVSTSSNTLDNVTAGEYTLRISREGYNDWQQVVTVESGLVTDVSVQLFPAEFDFEQLTKTNVNQMFLGQSSRYAYYSVTDSPIGSNLGIWQQTLQQSNIPLISETPTKISNLPSSIKEIAANGELELIPSPNDSSAILIANNRYFILATNTTNTLDETTELVLDYPILDISWLNNSNLMIHSTNMIVDYDVSDKTSKIIIFNDTNDLIYTKTSSGIAFVRNNTLFTYLNDSLREVVLENISLPPQINAIYGSQINDNELILQTLSNNLYFLDTTNSLLTSLGNYEIVQLAPSARSLLVNDGEKIVSINIKVSLVRNKIEIQKRNSEVTDFTNISKLEWSPNSNFFVYQTKSDEFSTLYSADAQGHNIVEILQLENLNTDLQFAIPFDNSGVIVNLSDSLVSTTSDTRGNLYKLKFQIED